MNQNFPLSFRSLRQKRLTSDKKKLRILVSDWKYIGTPNHFTCQTESVSHSKRHAQENDDDFITTQCG